MYYLAIDIGASSGRHMLGRLEDGKIVYEEIHRFPNKIINENGRLCWNIDALFAEVLNGMAKCAKLGKIPTSVGVDTWGVDFVLLDRNMEMLGQAVSYRDSRTQNITVDISDKELYTRTGIQKLPINTIYQLAAVKKETTMLDNTRKMLLIADYIHFLLCGRAASEYTLATTTGLVSATGRNWDVHILRACGFPQDIFAEITPPGTVLGTLLPEIRERVGYDCKVILPASHDTASAVVAVKPDTEIYISSGTWSLMGIETPAPNCNENSRIKNFTNEGGYAYRFRYLRNIMGLWMMQEVEKELAIENGQAALAQMAQLSNFRVHLDVNQGRFLAPSSMIQAIQDECRETGQQVPTEPGDIAAVIYHSLAQNYKETAEDIETLTGQNYNSICIIGGGVNAKYLNQLTQKYTGKTVTTGHPEATAMGNLAVQMLASGVFADLSEARWAI